MKETKMWMSVLLGVCCLCGIAWADDAAEEMIPAVDMELEVIEAEAVEEPKGEWKVSYDYFTYADEFISNPQAGFGGAQNYDYTADLDGSLHGFTISYLQRDMRENGVEFSLGYRTGSMDGDVDYNVVTAKADGDVSEFDAKVTFRMAHKGSFAPFLNIGYLYRTTERTDTLPATWNFAATGNNKSTIETYGHFFTFGGGATYAKPLTEKFVLGGRLEGNVLVGGNWVEQTGLEDGHDYVYGLNGKATIFGDYRFVDSMSLFAETGVLGQYWMSASDDMENTQTGYYTRLGLRYMF